MITYIALLRGINVGGHRKILMADLRTLLNQLEFEDVITYIQSGNVVFRSNLNASRCAGIISEAALKKYG
ncbi:MAG: hypothetical protein ACI9SJ_001783 [Flavobacteriaceae bacterium]|jgi:uncharacterized protein (DUF1697 family)